MKVKMEIEEEAKSPYNGKRYDIMGLNNRSQYIIVDEDGIVVTFPDNLPENLNYQSAATALARIISISIKGGIPLDSIRKQLIESSMQKGDTPDIILQAINRYVQETEELTGMWSIDKYEIYGYECNLTVEHKWEE